MRSRNSLLYKQRRSGEALNMYKEVKSGEWFDRKSTSSGYATYCSLKLKEVL